MTDIAKLFSQKNVISYVNNRDYPATLGDTLFPERKVPSLKTEILENGRLTPVIAPMAAFDAEAEIGSREANVTSAELGYIKRKMQLKEEDMMALRNPRNAEEQSYLTQVVYNDVDSLVAGVRARVELERMQLLANGVVNTGAHVVDYNIPKEHQVTVSKGWNDTASDPVADIQDWIDTMDVVPTRVLTSNKVVRVLLQNKAIQAYFKQLGVIPSINSLNNLFNGMGLPTIATYDQKYREQDATGKTTIQRYFPADKFVMFTDGQDSALGETLYGPTPEESRMLTGGSQDQTVGNIFATVYETSLDPIATWTKAAATALPTLANRYDLFQAKVLIEPQTAPSSSPTSQSASK